MIETRGGLVAIVRPRDIFTIVSCTKHLESLG
jgi:hypothetical protein